MAHAKCSLARLLFRRLCSRRLLLCAASAITLAGLAGCGSIAAIDSKRSELGSRARIPWPQIPSSSPAPGATAVPASFGAPAPESKDEASTLAEKVRMGGAEGQNALRNALSKSGISIRESDGRITMPISLPAQGYFFHSWEVQAMSRMEELRLTIPLMDIATPIAKATERLSGPFFAAILLDGLRTAKQSQDPTVQFWAVFIDALGSKDDEPFKLSEASDPERIRIDGVQTVLLLRRLHAEMQSFAARDGHSQLYGLPERSWPSRSHGNTRLALAAESDAPILLAAESKGESKDCEWGGESGADIEAYMRRLVFEKELHRLEHEGLIKGVDKLKFGMDVANSSLAIARLAMTMTRLDIVIEMDGKGPLKRTHHAGWTTGEKRRLTATIRYLPSDLTISNCARQWLNTVLGLDVNLPPSEEPAADAIVEWKGVSGVGEVTNTKTDWSITRPIVVLEPDRPRIQTYVGSPREYQEKIQSSQRTDEHGKATIGVAGAPQKKEMDENAPKVRRSFRVKVLVAPHPPNFVSAGIAGLEITGSGGASAIVDMILATRWLASPVFTFPVIDYVSGRYRLRIWGTATTHHDWGGVSMLDSKARIELEALIRERQEAPDDSWALEGEYKYSTSGNIIFMQKDWGGRRCILPWTAPGSGVIRGNVEENDNGNMRLMLILNPDEESNRVMLKAQHNGCFDGDTSLLFTMHTVTGQFIGSDWVDVPSRGIFPWNPSVKVMYRCADQRCSFEPNLQYEITAGEEEPAAR
jgi:hypothetical protein